MRFHVLASALALTATVGLAACDSSSDDDFDISTYVGTYTGTATATVPGQTIPSAPFTATVSTSGSNAVAIAFNAGSGDGVVTFTLRGTHSSSGASFTSIDGAPTAAVSVRVSGSGRVSGGITVPDFFGETLSLTASGSVTASSLNLSLASSDPAGTFTVVGTK